MTCSSDTLLYKQLKHHHNISNKSIEKVLGIAQQKKYAKGAVVLKEGQICKNILFVEKGYLKSSYNKDGVIINLNFSFEGEFATNLKSLRSQLGSDIVIQAGEDALIYQFDKTQLIDLYEYSPEITFFGREVLEQILMAQEEHSNLFKLYSATERYHYIAKHHPQYLQRISLTQLASYLGLSRETLTRIRKKN
ncbi:Crp/Fnr family transcriptional regulator [Pedobacter arcticus]|uniref:Crp/Fnr family transcriptional regulator n=1 Tax=Pedobacter arcticus TaxID=752140 RepID=UPI0002F94679|nr:Crp/Fnr family transcriptional regulator [Pedobacter arcticus]